MLRTVCAPLGIVAWILGNGDLKEMDTGTMDPSGRSTTNDGKICGMQSQTCHLDLNFDIEQDVFRAGKKKKITSYPFLHAGRCVHVDVLKDFMRQHNVAFMEQ